MTSETEKPTYEELEAEISNSMERILLLASSLTTTGLYFSNVMRHEELHTVKEKLETSQRWLNTILSLDKEFSNYLELARAAVENETALAEAKDYLRQAASE